MHLGEGFVLKSLLFSVLTDSCVNIKW